MSKICLMITMIAGSTAFAGEWSQLPSLPDNEGFAGPFAGVSHGALLVAGGANFPGKKPWDGGQKVWYDSVFVLEQPGGEWQRAGRLPRPLGYGVSVTQGNGVVCVGGSDLDRHYADAFRLEWKSSQLVTTALPSLPLPLANACGAMVGETLYIAGGQEQPESTHTVKAAWRIDLSAQRPTWKGIAPCPGSGRMLAVAASIEGAFWMAGGVDVFVGPSGMVERRYVQDAYSYEPDKGWRRIADLPIPVAAAPSPAPVDPTGFIILGGDDGSQVGLDPKQHRGFSKQMLRYDLPTRAWVKAGELPAPRVTVPCVKWNDGWVAPSGEMRPGVRSPEVWMSTSGKVR